MKTYFVNEAFEKAVDDYLVSKSKPEGKVFNSFLVVVIRMLVNIYGELDIINPFQIKSVASLHNNLKKYGASEEDITKLENLLDKFRETERESGPNKEFIEIQKSLIDLFTLKRINFGLAESESKEFFDLLYTPGSTSALRQSYNYLKSENIYEIAEYYKESYNREAKREEEEKDLLGFDIYRFFNISLSDLSNMNNDEVKDLNNQIYKSFDINKNAINKEYLLNEKIKEIKMQNNPITTGNGYVDILLVMSVIVTGIMVVIIFGTIVF